SVVHQDVVALEPQRQGGIVAGLKLQVDKPGLDLCDTKHQVRLGGDRGEIDVQDANVAKFAAQEQLQPRSGIALQQLFHCRVERLGHQRLFESMGSEEGATRGNRGWPSTPMTSLGSLCLELLSGKGLESAFLEEIGLKPETVFCHHGAVFPEIPMETRTVPWLHRLRLPPRGHLPNGHNGEPSVLGRSLVRCVSFSPLKSGNKSNKPPASTVAGTGFAGHCNPSS